MSLSVANPSRTAAWIRVVVGLLLTTVAIAVPVALDPHFVESQDCTYLLVTVIAIAALGPLFVRVARREMEFCDVAILLVMGFALHFVLGGIVPTIVGDGFIEASPGEPGFAWINLAGLFALFAVVALHFGYFSRQGHRIAGRFKDPPGRWNPTITVWVSLFAALLGLAIQVALTVAASRGVASASYESVDEFRRNAEGITYAAVASNLASLGMLALLVQHRMRRTPGAFLAFLILFPFQVVLQFVSGSRSSLGFFLIGVVIALYLTTDRRPRSHRRYLVISALALVVFVLLFPIISIFRYAGSVGAAATSDLADALTLDQVASQIGERFHGMSSLALVIKRVPHDIPYAYGGTMGDILIAWIPRDVWPEKPNVSLGKYFGDEVVPNNLFPPGSSVAVTLPAEFYWNFGLPGLLLGMYGLGVLLRILQQKLVAPRGNPSAVVMVTFMVPSLLMGIEQDIGAVVTYAGINYVLALLYCKLMARNASGEANVPALSAT